jgi:hypothetical protein
MHALEDSKGRLIHGRPVRTERARANRKSSAMFWTQKLTDSS